MARHRLIDLVRQLGLVLPDFQSVPDGELLRRYAEAHDKPAFEALVYRQSTPVWRVCCRITRDEHLAEEAFQDTFVALAANAPRIRDVGPWLNATARNMALAVRKRTGRLRAPEPLVPDAVPAAAAPDPFELREILLLELGRLRPEERQAVELHLLNGLALREVAEVMGKPPGTVGTHVARAKEKLKKRLARRGIHDLGVFAGLVVGAAPASVVAATVRAALARPAAAVGVAGATAHATALLSRSTVFAAGTAFALAAVAAGLVGLSPRVGGDPPPAAEAKPADPAVPVVRPEGMTARVVFSKDLPVGASGVAFSPKDGRLALGGWMEPGTDGVKTAPGRLWDGDPAADPTDAGPHGPGPVAFRTDGTPVFLVLPTADRWSLLLWDMDRNARLAELPLPGPGAAQVRAALSADGTLAAATVAGADDQNGHTLVWKLPAAAGEPVRELHHWGRAATALAFSPNNGLVAVGQATGTVAVRSVADGREVMPAVRTGHAAVLAVAFGRNFWKRLAPPTGPDFLLAAGSKGGHLGIWSLATGDKLHALAGSAIDIHAVAFSPDGTRLASVGRNRPIVWDVASGREAGRINHPSGANAHVRNWMAGVAFSPDGRRLAITSVTKFGQPGGLDVVELAENSAVRSLWGLNAPVEKVFLSPRGDWVVGLSQNWQLGVWEAPSGRLVGVVEVKPGGTADNAALKFDADEREAVFAAGSRAVKFDLATGREVDSWRLPADGLKDQLALLPDGNWLFFHSERPSPGFGEPRRQQVQRAYDLLPGGQIRVRYTLADVNGVQAAALSGDGRLLVLGVNPDTGNGSLRPFGFDGRTGTRVALSIHDSINGVRCSPAGSRMVFPREVGHNQMETTVFDCATGRRLATHAGLWSAIDDNGRVLVGAIGPEYRVIEVIDAGSGSLLKRFDSGGVQVRGLGITGRFVAWGQDDGLVRLAALDPPPDQSR